MYFFRCYDPAALAASFRGIDVAVVPVRREIFYVNTRKYISISTKNIHTHIPDITVAVSR